MRKSILAASLFLAGSVFAQDDPAAILKDRPIRVRAQAQAAEAEAEAGQVRVFVPGMPAHAQRIEKAAWLGVSCVPLPQGIRKTMDLPRGMGLWVAQVEAGSPAQRAGLAVQDVLLRVNEQQMFNEQQLRALIRTFKVDDELKLSVVRGDKPLSLTAKLIEREMPVLDEFWMPAQPGMPPMPGGVGMFDITNKSNRVENVMSVDSDGVRIEINDDGKVRHLKATGADGKSLFDGPINTEEQRKAVPADLLKRVDKLPVHTDVNVAPMPGMPAGRMMVFDRMGEQKIDWSDGDVDLTLTIKRKGKEIETHLLVKDDLGKKLFEGPVDTREQRGDVPVNLQDKLLQALLKNFQEAGGSLKPIRIRLDAPPQEQK